MMILKEFSRIVCVSLFSYQGSLFAALRQLVYFTTSHRMCQVLFWSFLSSNGEGGIWTLAPLLTTYSLSRGAPSASLGTSPNCPTQSLLFSEAFYIISRCFLFVKNFFNFSKVFLFSSNSGESGIRTHAPLRTNGFQDRLVMTTSISLHMHFSVFYLCISVRRKMYSIINLF